MAPSSYPRHGKHSLNVKGSRSAWPQVITQRPMARLNTQKLGRLLWAYCSSQQHEGAHFLAWAEYAQNSIHRSTTGLTPFECVLGYQPSFCPWDSTPTDIPAVDEWFCRAERVWKRAHTNIQRAINRFTAQVNRHRRNVPRYNVGDRVWLSTRELCLHLPSRKLSLRFIGPFPFTAIVNPVSLKLKLPSHLHIYPVFHVSRLRQVIPGPLIDELPLHTPPAPVEGAPVYQVFKLLDSRWRGGRLQYLVNWEGYGREENSWVPDQDIISQELVNEFHSSRTDCPAPRYRRCPPGPSRRLSRARPCFSLGFSPGGGGTVTPVHPPPHVWSPDFWARSFVLSPQPVSY